MNGFTTLGIVEIERPVVAPWAMRPDLIARRFGHHSLLEWIVRRVTDCQQLQRVIVVADAERANLLRHFVPADVEIFSSSREADSLSRFAAATRHFAADAVVRVSAKSPFVDPVLIDRLVATARAQRQPDYIGYRLADGRAAVTSRIGLLADCCRSEAVQRADQLASDRRDRQDPTRYICQHPELFQLRFISVPAELDRDDLRLAIDSEEDWENAHLIYDALGPDALEWQRITRLLDHQPALRARMASLNRITSQA